MPVFISHSHQDKVFVDRLASQLVLHRTYVWLDRWEIKVGDSLLGKVQEGIKSASALLIVLSKASVASEWCKKELNAGLMCELEEKRVVVLPIFLEDCEMPVFLKDKKYADFRSDFDAGLRETLIAVADVTSNSQGRIEEPGFHTDFSIAPGRAGSLYVLELKYIDHGESLSYCVLTEVDVICNQKLTDRFQQYESKGLQALGHLIIVSALHDYVHSENSQPFVFDEDTPKNHRVTFDDPKTNIGFTAVITSRRLGADTGMCTLIDWPRHIDKTLEHLLESIRPEERQRAREVFGK
jgi:hypothetical protein